MKTSQLLVFAALLSSRLPVNAQIYVGQSAANVVGAYNFDGTPINSSLIGGGYPWGGTYDGNGNIYWCMEGSQGVVRYTTSRGATLFIGVAGLPMHVALDGHGNLYTVDGLNQRVGKYTTSGATINASLARYAGGGFSSIACDGTYLYVGDSYYNGIYKFTTSGTLVSASLITLPFNTGPLAMVCDNNGHLFIASNDNRVGEYTTSGATVNASLISSGLDQPFGLALGPNGDIYVASQRSGVLGQYASDGTPINPALITGLIEPLGIVVVPEPSSLCLMLIGLAFLFQRLNRERFVLNVIR
jgi:sugar lactone lactonase YvrE